MKVVNFGSSPESKTTKTPANAKYIEAKAETELTLSHVFVLDKAYKAEKKAYPKKSVIVMVATFATFVLAVMAFLFFDSFLRKLRSS